MKNLILSLPLLCLSLSLVAQLQDDFSDGDFANNPEWAGQTEKFTVSNGELQLSDSTPGSSNTAYLAVPAPTSTAETTTWEFYLRLDFSPSGSNFARVYLSASSPRLDESQSGYFIRAGGISGDGDALELYREDEGEASLLISGTAGAMAQEPAVARVRATRTASGEWQLLADYEGGTNYQLEGSATDSTYPMGGFFGFYCQYTSTRSEAFFFDEVWISPLFVDTEPPVLLSVEALDSTTVIARFNEPLDQASASMPSRYSLDGGIGTARQAELLLPDARSVRLAFSTSMQSLQSYQLSVSQLADANGNVSGFQSRGFTYYKVEPAAFQDIIISELLPDPTPSVGLPEGEFIELYNRSNKVIQLSSLSFSSGGSPEPLPEGLLLPGSYLTLCDAEQEAGFALQGPTLSLPAFPALSNAADVLALVDMAGGTIFKLAYEDSWYQAPDKEGGGYSLEIIRLGGPYDCPGNWRASEAAGGGTPGQANSLLGGSTETTPPRLLGARVLNEFEVLLEFDERMAGSLGNPANYNISPGIEIMDVLLQEDMRQAILLLASPLNSGTYYELRLDARLTDCIGNPLEDSGPAPLGLSEAAEPGDFLINELLFNPETGGSDFIELFNLSGKVIDLSGMAIANTSKESGDTLAIVNRSLLFFPQSYIVLSSSPEDILSRYTVLNPAALFEAPLPTLDDKSGNVSLRFGELVIDAFDYSESLHYPLLDTREGVSLERISLQAGTQENGNWHSAASTAGFATPTAQNSQFFAGSGATDGMFKLARTTFSPDGDGFEDVLLLNYETDQAGYSLNAHIYDSQGRLVRRLANNESLAARGTLKWEGTNEEGSRARIGIYILWLEVFSPQGRVEREKKAIVLAGKFE